MTIIGVTVNESDPSVHDQLAGAACGCQNWRRRTLAGALRAIHLYQSPVPSILLLPMARGFLTVDFTDSSDEPEPIRLRG